MHQCPNCSYRTSVSGNLAKHLKKYAHGNINAGSGYQSVRANKRQRRTGGLVKQ